MVGLLKGAIYTAYCGSRVSLVVFRYCGCCGVSCSVASCLLVQLCCVCNLRSDTMNGTISGVL